MKIKRMNIKVVPISSIARWKNNPRNVKTVDIERLKKQIIELGFYKPLICCRENGKYITLGGDKRFLVLQSLNQKEVEISVVKAETDAMKLKYALSDNDNVGENDEQKIAELTYRHIEEIDLKAYKIETSHSISLQEVVEKFAPDIEPKVEKPELEISDELLESHNYIVLFFDNEIDWQTAREIFQIKAQIGDTAMKTTGIGRVVNGAEILKRLLDK